MTEESDLPVITVTMLGPSGSGKSTYLVGMYAVLSSGMQGYFLHARDYDQDLDLAEAWDAIVDRGLLPPPNDEVPKQYDFVFKENFASLLGIDWLDYRGGAMRSRVGGDDSDTAQLLARLNRSDAVYLVMDGAHLRQPVSDYNVVDVSRATQANRMNSLLGIMSDKRRKEGLGLPAFVILITKADLIEDDPNGMRSAAHNRAVQDVARLLPLCFVEGATTLVCPVQLGHFGVGLHAEVDPSDVDPQWLHKPIIFSLLYYLREVMAVLEENSESADRALSAAWERLSATSSSVLYRGRRAKLQQEVSALMGRRQDAMELVQAGRECAAGLAKQLEGLRVFVDGRLVSSKR